MTTVQHVADSIDTMITDLNDPESHVELDTQTFHPSQAAHCCRQMYLRKLGLIDNTAYQGAMHVGTVLHDHLERDARPYVASALGVDTEDVLVEHPVELNVADDDITFVGTADVWVPSLGVVLDWKTRGGWYSFDPANERYLDQLTVYAMALDAERMGIVYLQKKDMEARVYPEDDRAFATPELDRYASILGRAREVKTAIEHHGIVSNADDVPLDHCERNDGDPCYFCESETLVFD